jgi:hypothetical protein
VRFAQLGFSYAQFQVFAESRGDRKADEGFSTGFNVVGPNYFRTMETPLLSGRDFTEADRKGAPGVVVINETLAANLWPNEGALGKRVSVSGPEGPFLEVVGVARDGKYRSLGETPHPYIYQPLLQSYDPKMTLVVRTRGEPQSVATSVREQIRALDANLPVAGVKTLRDQLDLSLFPSRVAAWTLGAFGVLALMLAAIGIYGVVSYSVAQRTREIGLRLAVGATEFDVQLQFLSEAIALSVLGGAFGLLAGFLSSIAVENLFQMPTLLSPGVFAIGGLFSAGIGILFGFYPARKASQLNPIQGLRYE